MVRRARVVMNDLLWLSEGLLWMTIRNDVLLVLDRLLVGWSGGCIPRAVGSLGGVGGGGRTRLREGEAWKKFRCDLLKAGNWWVYLVDVAVLVAGSLLCIC